LIRYAHSCFLDLIYLENLFSVCDCLRAWVSAGELLRNWLGKSFTFKLLGSTCTWST